MQNLSIEKKARIFDSIFREYVTEHGLGGMSKADLDALLLWEVVSNTEINSFEISHAFKIKEGRVKSLLETAAVKFDKTTDSEAWHKILKVLGDVEFDVESLEKGQIRFQLKDPMLFRWLQEGVRNLNSTCSYHRGSEQVTMNLDVLYFLFDRMWEENYFSSSWKSNNLKRVRYNIKKAVGNVGKKIAENTMEDLRNRKKPKLKRILEVGSKLASIGSFINPLYEKI